MLDEHRTGIEHNTLFLQVNAPQLATAGYPTQSESAKDQKAWQQRRAPKT
jgi:hypothetical protein